MHATRPIPRDLQSRIDLELESGERIQWMDMPIPRYFTPVSTKHFIFAIPWTAFALFWTYAAAGFEMPNLQTTEDLFCLFGLPFILVGIALFGSPLWVYRQALKPSTSSPTAGPSSWKPPSSPATRPRHSHISPSASGETAQETSSSPKKCPWIPMATPTSKS